MSAFLSDWLNLALRWAHLMVGIAWIGTSFYFIALDLALRKRPGQPEGVLGSAWEVHGGGFYNIEKYAVAPPKLPPDLKWFQWDAYLTWVTGFALLVVQYYWHASSFLIDPSVMELSPGAAATIGAGSLVLGWIVYDRLVRSLVEHPAALALSTFALILLAAWGYAEIFSGRGALIHVGAFIGTLMAANVFLVIIPNQKKVVASLLRGEPPDPALGKAGKQRSLHNNYLTLPVLLFMVSNHYPILTGHPYLPLVVALVIVIGASVRHIVNRHEAGDPFERYGWSLPVGAMALVTAVTITAPREPEIAGDVPEDGRVLTIAAMHCVGCHAAHPKHEGFREPPKGVKLETLDELRRHSAVVLAQAVQTQTMPLGNQTKMTPEERAQLGAWLRAQR
jgi:uncharacterized membrane protein